MTRPLFSLSYGAFGGILMVLYSFFLIQLGGHSVGKGKETEKENTVLVPLVSFSGYRDCSDPFSCLQ